MNNNYKSIYNIGELIIHKYKQKKLGLIMLAY